jgi:RNA-directed DNA polymerase
MRRNHPDIPFERYADDVICHCRSEERLQEFALSLHSEKTRLIEFGHFAAENRKRRGLGKPETFTFLGFTFICSKTRRGKFQIKRKSRPDRMQAKLQAIKRELRRSMHQPIPQQGSGCSRSSPATSTTTRCRQTVRH